MCQEKKDEIASSLRSSQWHDVSFKSHCEPGPKEPIRRIARQSQVLRWNFFNTTPYLSPIPDK